MKSFMLLLIIALFCSCQPSIENTPETLEKVFAMSEFDIEIQMLGCFSSGIEKISVTKKSDGYLLTSITTGRNHLRSSPMLVFSPTCILTISKQSIESRNQSQNDN